MTTVETGCGLPIYNKRKMSMEVLEILAGLMRKDRTDARKHEMGSLLILTDAMRSCQESSNMASRAILCFGGDDGNNIEGLGSIRVDIFSRVDDNKDCFEDTDYNKHIYKISLTAHTNALDRMQTLSASDVSDLHIIINILF